jgi:hypothetical protein
MAQDNQLLQDEELRLRENSEKCHAEERALADQLLHPRHSMPYPEAMRLTNAFQSIRIECKKKWLAFRAYQKKMREDRRVGKINGAAVLQAHSLSVTVTHQIHAQPKDAGGSR